MGLFSKFRKPKSFNLKISDFKTESESATITSVWISPEFLNMLPHPIEDTPKNINKTKTCSATIQLFGQTIEISFDPDEIQSDLSRYIDQINQQLKWLSSNKPVVDKTINRDLLELKNSNWLEEDESPLTGTEFVNKLKLTTINFFDDTGFELWFDDGNTFYGHSIVVSITANRIIEDATIVG